MSKICIPAVQGAASGSKGFRSRLTSRMSSTAWTLWDRVPGGAGSWVTTPGAAGSDTSTTEVPTRSLPMCPAYAMAPITFTDMPSPWPPSLVLPSRCMRSDAALPPVIRLPVRLAFGHRMIKVYR
jgi:hypothetical protein